MRESIEVFWNDVQTRVEKKHRDSKPDLIERAVDRVMSTETAARLENAVLTSWETPLIPKGALRFLQKTLTYLHLQR